MAENAAPASGSQSEGQRAGHDQSLIWLAMWAGLALALIGLIDGVVMALHSRVAPCPDGTYFPPGTTNFTCYAQPNAGTGIAVAVISALLGILVVLSAISVGRKTSD
jgi:hypothetical protein